MNDKGRYRMNDLIAISNGNIGSETVQTVNARDLHSFLEVGKDFSNWIKDRIESFCFTENQDFIVFAVSGEKGRPSKEYAITLDMAKELSMVERNEKGKQARQYFIACERRAKQQNLIPQTLPEALRLAADLAEQNQILAPKAAIADRLSNADGSMNIRNAAKALKKRETDFVKWLLINKWIFRNKKGRLEGYATHTPRFIEHKVTAIPTDEDQERVSLQVMVTAEGLTKLAGIFNVELKAA